MGLMGNLASLLAGGSRYVPPPPPRPGPDSARSTSAAPPTSAGAPNPAVAPTATGAPNASTIVQPSEGPPAAAAQSVPRQGTPADASPTRPDFSPAPQRADEDSARDFAIAAQARERLGALVRSLADGPETFPALSADRSDKPERPLGGAGINATLPTLRGEKTAGAVLDKVA